jgi:hypothetical protein
MGEGAMPQKPVLAVDANGALVPKHRRMGQYSPGPGRSALIN